jgi:hypothetical protein
LLDLVKPTAQGQQCGQLQLCDGLRWGGMGRLRVSSAQATAVCFAELPWEISLLWELGLPGSSSYAVARFVFRTP